LTSNAASEATGPRNYTKEEFKKRHLFLNGFIPDVSMAAEALSVSSEFDIFAQKPIHTSVQETIETIFRPIASVDQSDLEFLIPAKMINKYIDLNIRLFFRGKLTACDGKDLEGTDFTAATNNFLYSFFTQCSISLNGTTITPTSDLYQYLIPRPF
jgi:hypothetical protein